MELAPPVGATRELDAQMSFLNMRRRWACLLGFSASAALFCFSIPAVHGADDHRDAGGDGLLGEDNSTEMEGFVSQVYEGSQLRHRIQAGAGRMLDESQIVELSGLDVRFYDESGELGELSGACGRMWLKTLPGEAHAQNDIVLSGGVRFERSGGWVVEAPEMVYTHADAVIRSDKGFRKQMKMKNGYMAGEGDEIVIKLSLEKNSFETWTERGTPVILKKSEGPVLE